MPHSCDDFINLVSRQLTTLTGLCALRHLDLQLVRIYQVVRRDSESSRGDLLHCTASKVSIGIAIKALLVFATFSCIRLAANAVHRNRESLVRFFTDGTERHCARRKALDDFGSWFNFLDRHRILPCLNLHQPAQRAELAIFQIDQVGVFPEGLRIP